MFLQKVSQKQNKKDYEDTLGLRTFTNVNENYVMKNFTDFSQIQTESYGYANYIEFHPTKPRQYLITQKNAVQLIDDERKKIVRYTKFRDNQIFSASYRKPDGQIFAVSGSAGGVKIFQSYDKQNAISKLNQALRTIVVDNANCTQFVKFLPQQYVDHIITGSDDGIVRIYDILNGKKVRQFNQFKHSDYIRTGCVFDNTDTFSSSNMFATGAYDHTIKLWDVREQDDKACIMSFDHGAPVECVVKHPTAPILYSSGGNYFKAWDLLQRKEILKIYGSHQKTITSISLATGEGNYLMTSGLDHLVCFFKIDENYSQVHNLAFDGPVLSSAISKDERQIVLGLMNPNRILKSKRIDRKILRADMYKEEMKKENYKNYVNTILLDQIYKMQDEIFLPGKRSVNLVPFKKLLSYFKYKQALQLAVTKFRTSPIIVLSLLVELESSGALLIAIDNLNVKSLSNILLFLIDHIRDPRCAPVLIPLASTIIKYYGQTIGLSENLDKLFRTLRKTINQEIQVQQQLCKMKGVIDFLMISSAALGSTTDNATKLTEETKAPTTVTSQ
ncbi:hypothetical protein ABK040_010093 [Willaertia magna]